MTDNYPGREFLGTTIYENLRPYLSDDVKGRLESSTEITTVGGRGMDPYRRMVLEEVSG